MLEKFRKLEERLFNLECKETEEELSICIPRNTENQCEECNYVTEYLPDLEKHQKYMHGSTEIQTLESDEIKPSEEIYKCSLCDFSTTHHPGLKSHTTKMHGEKVKHPCELCSETFETKKKLKNHIYCIHSGKYKTLAQLIDEAVP